MRTKVHFLSFDQVLSTLRTLGFDVQQAPGVANQILVRKYGAGAILAQATGEDNKLPHTTVDFRNSGIPASLRSRQPRIPCRRCPALPRSCGRSSASRACTTSPWARPATATYTTASKAAICRSPNAPYRPGNCLRRVANFSDLREPQVPRLRSQDTGGSGPRFSAAPTALKSSSRLSPSPSGL